VEDVILNTDDEATERLITLAATVLAGSATVPVDSPTGPSWRSKTIEERLTYALSKGDNSHLADDIPEALEKYGRPIDVIEQPLMQAMEHIGQLFGEGKMFLPQVVKSAKVMKDAVAILQPYIDEEQGTQKTERPCVVLATANGDVHDIGKNIVGIVLGCNGFDVVDLGVMVPNETILEETQKRKPCLVGISGLITPSLKEMEQLCQLFQKESLRVPIVVGGATTSPVHTAVKLAPLYDGCVVHGGDASQTSLLAKHLQMDAKTTIAQVKAEQQTLRDAYEEHHAPLTPYAEANSKAPVLNHGFSDKQSVALRSHRKK
jgi:5-methyltetrahydrofolate--homocysteine methyltransferase